MQVDMAREEAIKLKDYQKLAALDEQQQALTKQINDLNDRIANNVERMNNPEEEQEAELRDDNDTLHVFYTILIKFLQAKDIRIMSPQLHDLLKIILEQVEILNFIKNKKYMAIF